MPPKRKTTVSKAPQSLPHEVASQTTTNRSLVKSVVETFSQAAPHQQQLQLSSDTNQDMISTSSSTGNVEHNNARTKNVTVVEATASLLHGMFLIAHTHAVQLAPRVAPQQGSAKSGETSENASPTSAKTSANGIARAVRLPLRAPIIAAIQAVVPSHVVDPDVIRRVCQCAALPQNMCMLQTTTASSANLLLSPKKQFGQIGDKPIVGQSLSSGIIPPLVSATATSASSVLSMNHDLPWTGNNLLAAATMQTNNWANRQQSDIVILRSPISDEIVPTEAQLATLLRESKFAAADARLIWFGINSAATPMASPIRTTTSSTAKKKVEGAAAVGEEDDGDAAGAIDESAITKSNSVSKKRGNSTTAKATKVAGTRRQREDEDDTTVQTANKQSNTAAAATAAVPRDLLPFLNEAKQQAICNFAATEAVHVARNTDQRIRERRNINALVTTLNVVRSAVGPDREETGIVSLLRRISSKLQQDGFAIAPTRSATVVINGDCTKDASTNAKNRSDRIAVHHSALSDGTVTVASMFGSNNCGGLASWLSASSSATLQPIIEDAVSQFRLLLAAENASTFYQPATLQQIVQFDVSDAASVAARKKQSVQDFDDELRNVGGRAEQLSGIVYFPHSESAVKRRSVFLEEVAEQLNALK